MSSSLFDGRAILPAAALSIACTCVLYKFTNASSDHSKSSLSSLRGPPSDSIFVGNMMTTRSGNEYNRLERWATEYGRTFVTNGFLGAKELYVADVKAAGYIYNHHPEFCRPRGFATLIKHLTGPGLLTAVGDEHQKQRKVLNPAFSASQTRRLVPAVLEKSIQLRDVWVTTITEGTIYATVDVLDFLGRICLDMIGETAFGYQFNSLHDPANEVAAALHELMSSATTFDAMAVLTGYIPVLKHLPTTRNENITRSFNTMRKVGEQLVAQKKAEITNMEPEEAEQLLGKDLLSVLIKSNLAQSDTARLDDETVLAQIMTIIVAGHETLSSTPREAVQRLNCRIMTIIVAGHETLSSAVAWALYSLCQAPDVQEKLRREALAVPTDSPTMEELQALPYLDKVTKETLRLHSPTILTLKCPRKDVVLPLAYPVVDKTGKQCYEVCLAIGDTIILSNQLINTDKELWGPDAQEFRPDRFDSLPATVSDIPSIFANMTTFGSGPGACIGWRLAILEMKALLFILLRTLDFSIDPGLRIGTRALVSARPIVLGEEDNGTRLPLRISLHHRD